MSRSRRGGRERRMAKIRGKKETFLPQEFTGVARMTRDGFLFVTIEGLEEDIYVGVGKTLGALNGDTVRVAIIKPQDPAGGGPRHQDHQAFGEALRGYPAHRRAPGLGADELEVYALRYLGPCPGR